MRVIQVLQFRDLVIAKHFMGTWFRDFNKNKKRKSHWISIFLLLIKVIVVKYLTETIISLLFFYSYVCIRFFFFLTAYQWSDYTYNFKQSSFRDFSAVYNTVLWIYMIVFTKTYSILYGEYYGAFFGKNFKELVKRKT